jgi:hypothetical protein
VLAEAVGKKTGRYGVSEVRIISASSNLIPAQRLRRRRVRRAYRRRKSAVICAPQTVRKYLLPSSCYVPSQEARHDKWFLQKFREKCALR